MFKVRVCADVIPSWAGLIDNSPPHGDVVPFPYDRLIMNTTGALYTAFLDGDGIPRLSVHRVRTNLQPMHTTSGSACMVGMGNQPVVVQPVFFPRRANNGSLFSRRMCIGQLVSSVGKLL